MEILAAAVSLVPEPGPERVAWAHAIPLPMKDAPIMAAAVLCGSDLLVTGDRLHFGHLFGKTLEGVRVLSPRETLHLLLETE